MCSSVLVVQRVAVCRCVLQRVAVCRCVLQRVAVRAADAIAQVLFLVLFSYLQNDLFMCTVTHSYVCRDSFMYLP